MSFRHSVTNRAAEKSGAYYLHLWAHGFTFTRKGDLMPNKIKRIRSGGQTGVDRAALDIARKYHIEICGWCPKGGWAEDFPSSPGLLAEYPELKETPSAGTSQRTRLFVAK